MNKTLKHHQVFSGTSLLRTLWHLDFSPYYRGFLNSEVTFTPQYYTETQNGVHITEAFTGVSNRSHCVWESGLVGLLLPSDLRSW